MKYPIELLSQNAVLCILNAIAEKYHNHHHENLSTIHKRIASALAKTNYQWFVVYDVEGRCLAVGSFYENSPHVYWVRLTEYGDCTDFELIERIVEFVKDATQLDGNNCVFLAMHDIDDGWF